MLVLMVSFCDGKVGRERERKVEELQVQTSPQAIGMKSADKRCVGCKKWWALDVPTLISHKYFSCVLL